MIDPFVLSHKLIPATGLKPGTPQLSKTYHLSLSHKLIPATGLKRLLKLLALYYWYLSHKLIPATGLKPDDIGKNIGTIAALSHKLIPATGLKRDNRITCPYNHDAFAQTNPGNGTETSGESMTPGMYFHFRTN